MKFSLEDGAGGIEKKLDASDNEVSRDGVNEIY